MTVLAMGEMPVPARARAGVRLDVVAVVMSGLLLILSIGAAIFLVTQSPEVGVSKGTPLSSNAERSSYGGDAYTGIQNAAADTESAVVDGSNALVAVGVQQSLQDAQQWQHLYAGLAALLVLISGLGFTASLSRLHDPRALASRHESA